MKINDLKQKSCPLIFTESEFKEVIMCLTEFNDIDFALNNEISESSIEHFFEIAEKFEKEQKPLAYILKSKYFYKFDFFVNENVLIPRPETELMIDEALKNDLEFKNVFDICCGSGCVGITLKKLVPSIKLLLSDISEEALRVTKINLQKHNLTATVFCEDFLKVFKQTTVTPDLILINPPYIDADDENIDKSVSINEPHLALFAENDGLDFYIRLFDDLEKLFALNEKLVVICEFGFMQKEEIEELFLSKIVKYKIDFKKDFSNNWRFFVIKLR